MANPYTRQSSFSDGDTVTSALFNDEYDKLVLAFSSTVGHTHDGSTGEGAPITKLGPTQDVVIAVGSILPKTNNVVDLGSSSLKFKDGYFAGNVTVDGVVTHSGNMIIGDAATDTLTINATIQGSSLVFEGATANAHELTLAIPDATSDVTVTLPNATDTLVGKATTDTLTNKTLTSAVLNTGVSGTAVLDEDDMATDSATQLATQQSIKAYVDTVILTEDTLAEMNDTNITSPGDAALLLYDTGTSTWRDAAMSGDATIGDTGVITIGDDRIDSQHYAAGSIDNEHLADDAVDSDEIADGAVDFAHIQDVAANSILGRNANSSGVLSEVALATTEILIGDGTGFTAAALSGDVTMTNAGVVTIGNDAIDSEHYAAGSIDNEHLADDAVDSDEIADGAVDFAHIQDVAANSVLGRNANSSGVLSEVALATTEILIGDGTGFTAAALSGDVTMANTGAVTIGNDKIDSQHYAAGSIDNEHLADDAVDSDEIADGAVDFAHIQDVAANSVLGRNANSSGVLSEVALATTEILIGDGTGFTAAALSGDVTMANTGAVTIGNDKIDSQHYATGSVDFAHIQDVAANSILGRDANSSGVLSEVALATTEILIGDGTGFTAAALSGDVTMANTGAVTIGNDKIDSQHYAAGSIDNEHLADDAVDSDEIADGAVDLAHMSSESVDEDNLQISNAGTNGQYLQKQSGNTGGLTWADVDALPSQSGNAGKYLTTNASTASWATLDTDANTTTKGLYEHEHTIDADYSIASGSNAMSAGPITIDTGNSVTVPTGSTWVIV